MDRRTAAVALGAAGAGLVILTRVRRKTNGARSTERAHSSRTVTIRAQASALYAQWIDPDHLAAFYRGVPMEIVSESPGKRYEWRTVDASAYRGGGSLTFVPAPADRGTQARLALYIEGPGSRAGAAFARIFGSSPAQIAMESLRAFKAIAETGEAPQARRR